MKKSVLAALALGLALSGCNKDESFSSTDTFDVSNAQQLNISKNFDWKTTKATVINLKAQDGVTFNELRPITVKTLEGGVIMSKMIRMNEDNTLFFESAKATEAVIVEFGGVSNQVDITTGEGVFDFMTPQGFEDMEMEVADQLMEADIQFANANDQ